MKKVKDHYFHKAKLESYLARSVYKLEAIQNKFKLLKSKQKILDLGCFPGSWSQYISKKIGTEGRLIGIDLKKIKDLSLKNAEFIQADLLKYDFEALNIQFNGIVCDAAPDTTGIRMTDSGGSYEIIESCSYIVELYLKEGGFFVGKILQGFPLEDFKAIIKPFFNEINFYKPDSSRKESTEIFIIAQNKKKL